MSELQIQRCASCGNSAFPDRLWCPRCSAARLHRLPAGPGVVEQETIVRRPPAPAPEAVRLGTVRLDAGPVVIARLATGVGSGARVRLERTAAATIWARAAPD